MDEKLTEFLEEPVEKKDEQDEIPHLGTNGWSDYVLSKFNENELFDGYPKVNGLRRVVSEVLGVVTKSISSLVCVPTNEHSPAVSQHLVEVKSQYGTLTVQDIGEANPGGTNPNLKGPFINFAVSISATRAEARALRKLLQVDTVAYEERMESNTFEGLEDSNIKASQIKFIEKTCEELGIDSMRFVNSGNRKFKEIKEVTYDQAIKMIDKLQKIKASGEIPDKLKDNQENN